MIVDGNIVRPVPPSDPIPNPWGTESGYGTGEQSGGSTGVFSLRTHRSCLQRVCPGFQAKSLTFVLTVGQVLAFLVTWIVSLVTAKSTPFLGVSFCTLYHFGAKWAPAIKYHFEVHRLILPIFLHTGFVHLLVNMFSQCSLMFAFEDEAVCGRKRLMLFYVLCGIVANAIRSFWIAFWRIWSPDLLLTLKMVRRDALLFVWPMVFAEVVRRGEIERQQRQMLQLNLVSVVVVNLLISFSAPAIDTSAHLGGLFAGVLGGVVVLRPPEVDQFNIHKYTFHCAIAFAFVLVLFTLLIWAVDVPQENICV